MESRERCARGYGRRLCVQRADNKRHSTNGKMIQMEENEKITVRVFENSMGREWSEHLEKKFRNGLFDHT